MELFALVYIKHTIRKVSAVQSNLALTQKKHIWGIQVNAT